MIRSCQRCGTTSEWESLPFLAIQECDGDLDYEMRNCPCGCTLCLSTPYLAEASRWVRLCVTIRVKGAIHVHSALQHGTPLSYEGRAWLTDQMGGPGNNARLARALWDRLVGKRGVA